MWRNLYSHSLSTHHPQLTERMFPHVLRHNKASGKKLPPKGKDASTHLKWNKVRDVLLRMCEDICVGSAGVKTGGRKLESKAWRERRRQIGVHRAVWGELGGMPIFMCTMFSVLFITETTSEPEPALRRTLSGEERDFKAHLSSFCQGASFNPGTFLPSLAHTNTHSDTHSIAFLSSVSNETPTDLYDTNNSTQRSLLCDTVRP